jgi:hypothetical protein
MKKLLLSTFSLSSLLLANAATVDFNHYVSPADNDLANNFHVMYYRGTPAILSQLPTGGITGGALQFASPQNYGEAIYLPSVFRNSPGDSYVVSGFFRVSSDTVSFVLLGFSTRADDIQLYDGPSPLDGGAFTVYYSTNGLQVTSRSGGDGGGSYPPVPVPISTNNWYRFSLSVVQNAASQDFTLTGMVEDYGISGTNNPVLLGSTAMTRPNAYMLATPRVYAGLGAVSGRNGYSIPQFDNFQANGVTCSAHGAQATAQIASGLVTGITVVDGGCGYTNTPAVLILGGGGSGAAAFASISNEVVTSITLTNGGNGYTSIPQVYIYSPFGLQGGLVKAVKPSFSDLRLGTNYQLQTSGDLITWTNQGSPFTATNPVMVYPAYFDVDNWNQLFFRVQVTP